MADFVFRGLPSIRQDSSTWSCVDQGRRDFQLCTSACGAFPGAQVRLRGDLAVDLQFRHVVDDAEELPLGVDLGFPAQRESAQAALLGMPEHRLDQAHAMGVDRAALGAVDLLAHGAAVRVGPLAFDAADEEGHLPDRGDLGLAQALAA